MSFPSKELVESLRKRYPVGCRVELLRMDDPQAPPIGTRGTVRGVDDIGSTYHYEKVVHSAGARTSDYGTEAFLQNLIKSSGFTPVRTAANYAGDKP